MTVFKLALTGAERAQAEDYRCPTFKHELTTNLSEDLIYGPKLLCKIHLMHLLKELLT